MNRFISLAFLAGLSACASYAPREVADPNAISVEDAFHGVAVGLADFGDTLNKHGLVLGLVTCKVTVNFNISAQATKGGTLGAAAGAGYAGVTAKLSAQQTNGSTGNRGNTVEVVMGSVYPGTCAPVDGGGGGSSQSARGGAAGGGRPAAGEKPDGGDGAAAGGDGAAGPFAPRPKNSRIFALPEGRQPSQVDIDEINRELGLSGLRIERITPGR